jgi:hypothetical protein
MQYILFVVMMERAIRYLRSKRFKTRVYTLSMFGLMGLLAYEVLTFNQPMFKNKRKETGGYDGHDDD